MSRDPRRALPSIDRLRHELQRAEPDLPAWALGEGARQAVAGARHRIESGEPAPEVEATRQRAVQIARDLARPTPSRVVNATGVVLHTNLGRAVLPRGAAEAVAEAASAYTDLELDLASGERGNRLGAVTERLRILAGSEAALAVNNTAAAVLLALNSLARGREVVVSRGELVEIGGSFRVPEILERAGVRLVEVGTTNRTHPADYERAVGPDTGAILKVHRSNFEQRGFVAEVGLEELVRIGRERGVPVIEDLGSGTLLDLRQRGLPGEAYAPARLATGVDLVCFSGDKLLGGPQAGLVLGRAEAVAAMRKNPLARALRLDKLTLAALDWVLGALLDGREHELPTLRQLLEAPDAVERRARELAGRLAKAAAEEIAVGVESTRAPVGGGSVPGFSLPSFAVTLRSPLGAPELAARLRRAPVPVISRVAEGRVQLDVRTLLPGDEALLEAALEQLPRSGC